MKAEIITAHDVFGDTHSVDISRLQWRPSVYGIVLNGGNILLVPQFGDKLDLPGGGVDLGEDLEDAVVREVKEETGIDVDVVKFVAVKSSIFAAVHDNEAEDKVYHSILVYYLCKKLGGELSDTGFDEYEKQYAGLAQWVPLTSLDDVRVASTVDYRPIVKGLLNRNGD